MAPACGSNGGRWPPRVAATGAPPRPAGWRSRGELAAGGRGRRSFVASALRLGKRPAMLRGGGEKVSGVQKQRQQKRGGPACAIEEARYPAEYGINGESPLLLQWALVYPLQRALRYPRPAGADSAPGATIMRRRQPVSWRNGGGPATQGGRTNKE